MVNLRYHIVSIVAVFLALGIGVVMGATVVDPVTVDVLQENLNRVQESIEVTRTENARLRDDLAMNTALAEQARDLLVDARLTDVGVVLVVAPGVEREPVDELSEALAAAGARRAGVIRLASSLGLGSDSDIGEVARIIGITPGTETTVRRQVLAALASAIMGATGEEEPDQEDPPPTPSAVLTALVDAGYLAYEPAPAATATSGEEVPAIGLETWPLDGLQVVVVSGPRTTVADSELAEPLVRFLAEAASGSPRVVAAANSLADEASGEAGQDPSPGLVSLLRDDGAFDTQLSTVDNLARPEGQAAAVLAIAHLTQGRTGHYGVGPRADRLLPALQA